MKTTTTHRHRHRHLPAGILSTGLCLLSFALWPLTPAARSQAVWNGGTGSWNDSTNWSTNAVPVTSNTIIVNDGLAHIAQGSSNAIARFMLGDSLASSSTLVVDGNLTYTAISYIGGNGEGYVRIGQSGSLIIASSFRVGGYAAADAPNANHVVGTGTGYVLVEGFLGYTGATVRTIAAGYDGAGRIDVAATGTVRSGDFYIADQALSSGTINVWGLWEAAGSIIRVGSSSTMALGSNVLNIHDGGKFLGTLSSNAALINIGNAANSTGIINIEQGGIFSASGSTFSIAQGTNSRGEVNVDGLFETNAFAYIGNAGHAVLNIGQTGTFRIINTYAHISRNAAGSGTANVRGLFDIGTSLQVGYGGNGFLNIYQTGTAIVGNYSAIGSTNNSYGEVNVEGLWRIGSHLYLGRNPTVSVTSSGTGVLNILPSGTVLVVGNFIGSAIENTGQTTAAGITSTGTASVAGLLDVTGNTILGQRGTTYLDILEGGIMKVGGYFRVSNNAAGTGCLNVAGNLEIASTFYVGENGIGHLNVASTGSISATSVIQFGSGTASAYGTGTIAGYIGTLNTFSVGQAGTGSLYVLPGGRVEGATFYVGNTATGNGTLYVAEGGSVVYTANGWWGRNAGSSGTVTVAGYMSAGGYIVVGNGGASASSVMTIESTGTVFSTDLYVGGNETATNGSSGTTIVHGLYSATASTGGLFIGVNTNNRGVLIVGQSGTVTANGNLTLGRDASASGTVTVDGFLSVGGTTIIANGANSNGTLNLNGGILQTSQISRGSGNATILFNGGTIRAAANTASFFNNFPTLDLASGTLALDTQAFTVTATNALAGTSAAALDKLGAGTLTLTGNNAAYAGAINVRAGSLTLGAATTLGGTASIFSGASLNLAAASTLAGTANIHSGASLTLAADATAATVNVLSGASIRPTAAGATVTTLAIDTAATLDLRSAPLTVGTLNLADGAIWQYSFSGTHALAAATIDVAGTGTFYLDRDGMDIPLAPGSYTLATFDTLAGAGDFTTWTIIGNDYSFIDLPFATIDTSSVPGTLKITIGLTDVEQLLWKGGDGNWDTTTADWRKSAAPVLWADGAFAIFAAGAGNITLADGLYTAFGLQFGDTGSDADYTIAGTGTITFGSAANIKTITAATRATINTTLAAPALNKTGPGTLTLGGPATITGLSTIGAGTLDIAPGGTLATAGLDIAPASTHAATVNISGLLTSTAPLTIGNAGAGTLTIKNGGAVHQSAETTIGRTGNATGLLHIETGALYKQTSGYLNIAGAAAGETATSGTLIIENGGTATTTANIRVGAYGTGTALIDGYLGAIGSGAGAYIGVYEDAQATVTIGERGILETTSVLTIGYRATSTGTLTVEGLAKIGGNIQIGQGDGALGSTLHITPTGTVTSAGLLSIGHGAGSGGAATVDGLLTATGNLLVANGANSTGSLDITGTVTTGGFSYIGNALGSTGTVTIAPGAVLTATGNYTYVGYEGTGILAIDEGGIANTNYLQIAAKGAASSGTVIVNGYLNNTTGMLYVGGVGDGTFIIGQTGTVSINSSFRVGGYDTATANPNPNPNFILGAGTGYARVEGLLSGATRTIAAGFDGSGRIDIAATGTINNRDVYVADHATATGTANVWGLWQTDGNVYIANYGGTAGPGNAVLNIYQDGRFIANDATKITRIGYRAGSHGIANIEGLLAISGTLANGDLGTGLLNIAPTGTIQVGARYTQNAASTLAITRDPARTGAYITAADATLSGTLALSNYGASYTPIAKSSELASAGVLILTATSGNITGNFTAFTGFGAGAPDYIVPGGAITTDPATGYAHYRTGYRLAWNDPMNAHGTFTLAAGETFEVDTPLVNRLGDTSPGWDKRTLTKEGAGTLILSAQNTFTGTLAINAGAIRLAGPATHAYGPLLNRGTLDFGTAPASAYRTVEVTSLAGNGSYNMTINPATGASDRLVVRGDATGTHHLNVTAAPALTTTVPSATLATITGKNDATFTGGLDYNGANYAVLAAPDGKTITLGANGDAGIHDAIRGIPGAQSLMWFASQDNLTRRIGELRIPGTPPDDTYSAWIRVRAEHSNLKSGTNMRPFDMDLIGFDLGADKTYVTLASSRILIGFYAGYGHAKQDFAPRAGTGTAEGTSDQIALGIYTAWLHNDGWFANLTITGARYDNEFTSADQSGNPSRGKYNDNALGASLEFGKRITLGTPSDLPSTSSSSLPSTSGRGVGGERLPQAIWFAEPTAQATHIRLMRDDYRTTGANRLAIEAGSAVITRLRATLRAGRAWGQTEISARAGIAHETSSGGELRINAGRWRPNIDGTRAEAGIGVIYRPWDAGHLYFDYEFATGDAYQKPWSLSLGYRHSF